MRAVIAAVLLIPSGLPALAKSSSDLECSRFLTMNAAGQMAAVDSMRSSMPAAHKMASSHEMVKKVAAKCKDHPGAMVHQAMINAMPH
jgi:hypothetical protein